MASLADRWHSAILKNSLDLMRFDAHQRTEIIAMINQLGRGIVADLSGAGLDTPRTDWKRARLRELLKAATDRIGGTYEDIATAHAEGLAGAAEASATGLTLALNDAVGFELLQAIKWTPEQLAALVDGSMIVGAPSSAWWARQSVDLQNAFADQMQQGMLRGEALGDLTGRVKDLLGVSTRNAEGLVRTSAMAVNNSAHMALYQANADVIAELSWTATLDLRTCFECAKHDGEQWPLNTPHAVPPIHFNDRCVVVPITKTWEQLANKNKDLARELDNMPPGLRSSMGGPVSANTTWEDWFKGLKPEQQSEYLGPARQKLWDAGKLSLSDLTDQKGNPLTLAQLRGSSIDAAPGVKQNVSVAKNNIDPKAIERHPYVDLKNQLEAKYGQHLYRDASDAEISSLEKLEKDYYSTVKKLEASQRIPETWSKEKAAADQEAYNLLHPMSPSLESPDWKRYADDTFKYTIERTKNAPYGGDPANGGVFYHVVGKGYKAGDDLVSIDKLESMGKKTKWKWEFDKSKYADSGIISLHDNIGDAISFQQEYGGKILKITIPPGSGLKGLVNREGYAAIFGEIPAEYIDALRAIFG